MSQRTLSFYHTAVTTFDLHIMRRLLGGLCFFLAILIVFFVVLHYVEFSDDFFDRGATFREVFLTYYPSYIPQVIQLSSPLALFLSCVYLTGKLAQELQLVALQTSGVSLYRLMLPYVLVAAAVTGFMFWFNGWIVPVTNQVVLDFDQKYLKDAPQQLDISDIHRQNSPGTIITVGFYDARTRSAHRVSLQRFTQGERLTDRIDAPRMVWVDSLARWRLYDATVRTFGDAGRQALRTVPTLDTLLQVYPRDLARTERDVESMTIPAATEYVAALRRSGAGGTGRPLVAYYTKFAYPLANLILIFIGVPLASVRRRGGQAVQLCTGLATAFLYLILMKLTEPFGYSGALSPLATAWIPHLVFFGIALVMMLRVRK